MVFVVMANLNWERRAILERMGKREEARPARAQDTRIEATDVPSRHAARKSFSSQIFLRFDKTGLAAGKGTSAQETGSKCQDPRI